MDDLAAVFGSLVMLFLIACFTFIPWAIGITHMWDSIFG